MGYSEHSVSVYLISRKERVMEFKSGDLGSNPSSADYYYYYYLNV